HVSDAVEVGDGERIGLLKSVLGADVQRVQVVRNQLIGGGGQGGGEQPLVFVHIDRIEVEGVRTAVGELVGRVVTEVTVVVGARVGRGKLGVRAETEQPHGGV